MPQYKYPYNDVILNVVKDLATGCSYVRLFAPLRMTDKG